MDSALLRFDPPLRGRVLWCLLLEVAAQHLVHKCEGHPGVGAAIPVDGAPAGVRGQDLGRAGAALGGQKVAGRNYLTRGEGAQPALDELVEADQVRVELQGRVRDEAVDAVCCLLTTCSIEVAEKRSNDVDPPLATDS